MDKFEIIVVGGGHAGVEAASAAARMGVQTCLVTHSIEKIGEMSCNPAIGGIGKSHLAKEVDALGGLMARAADEAGIHYRVLNSTKGQAVRATRVQTDRDLYRKAIQKFLKDQPNLTIVEASVEDIVIKNMKICSIVIDQGQQLYGEKLILTTGTFLGGIMHTGLKQKPGGRVGDPPSIRLAEKLRELPLSVGRLKTGTPPRLHKNSIDWSQLSPQPGDLPTPFLSYVSSNTTRPPQIECFMTRTNKTTHQIIRDSLAESPMFTGAIEGVGPRYCPSIEDKVTRFSERDSHQIFAEPEGITSELIYPNGISTSLPRAAQEEMVRSIKGFEEAEIVRPGYAIEYDYFNPTGLYHSLETRCVEGLYFAGQINGTTGYEEAAAQGLIAGINATLSVEKKEPLTLGRHEAYIGVLIDDLVSLGTKEPYRMFTSRAEYRLIMREDNADMRLTKKGKQMGLVGDRLWQSYEEKSEMAQQEILRLTMQKIIPETKEAKLLEKETGEKINSPKSLKEILKRPKVSYTDLPGQLSGIHKSAIDEIEASIKYAGYIERQRVDIERLQRNENTIIPDTVIYENVVGLSNEVKQKLSEARPQSLARASRLPGVTPAAVSLLMVYLKKERKRKAG